MARPSFFPAGHWVHGAQGPSSRTKVLHRIRDLVMQAQPCSDKDEGEGSSRSSKVAWKVQGYRVCLRAWKKLHNIGSQFCIIITSIGARAFCFYFFEDKFFFWDPLPAKKGLKGLFSEC